MVAVDLCDRLRFQPTRNKELSLKVVPTVDNGFEKLADQDNAWEIPGDSSNLVIRALEAIRKRFGIHDGMCVQLRKGIPSQAGLGGGSSDAAGAIVGGMLAWLGEFREEDAAELASGLGSDINFFIESRATGASPGNWLARCRGRGEKVEPIQSDWSIDFVVVHPPQGCSTRNIFRLLAESNTKYEHAYSVDAMIRTLESQDRVAMAKKLFNRLSDPAAIENPWVERILEIFNEEIQVDGCCVSGSGSSVFAVVESAERAAQLADRLKKQHPVRAYAVRSWQTPSIGEQLSTLIGR
jgi:4-diphosphocytidyl-2-C-methyl-D-erythritol kinase